MPAAFVEDLGQVVSVSSEMMLEAAPVGDVKGASALGHYMKQSGRQAGLPVLCLGSGRACEAEGESLIRVAAAVDLLYFACVHHDDVADDGGSRHGRETINRAWSSGVGVWSGDVLFFTVFGLIQEHLPEALSKTLGWLARAAASDMRQFVHAGQVERSADFYFEAVAEKAGLLCGLACSLGARVSTVGSEGVRQLEEFGVEFGTAFQIADDARDYGARRSEGEKKELGQDFAAGIVTLPVMLAWERGTEKERVFWRRALNGKTTQVGDFERAVELLERHEAIAGSLREAREYGERAKGKLAGFRNEAADGLAWMVDRYIADVEA